MPNRSRVSLVSDSSEDENTSLVERDLKVFCGLKTMRFAILFFIT
jgi:hypothetical protein